MPGNKGLYGPNRKKRQDDSDEWLNLDNKMCFNKNFGEMSSTDATAKCATISSQIINKEDLNDMKAFAINEAYAFKEGPPYVFWTGDSKAVSSETANVIIEFIECPASNKKYIICQAANSTSRYHGCYKMEDASKNIHKEESSHMSVSFCIAICQGQNASFAAITQNSCYCSNSTKDLGIDSEKQLPNKCTTHCEGRLHQMCGSEDHASVFQAGN